MEAVRRDEKVAARRRGITKKLFVGMLFSVLVGMLSSMLWSMLFRRLFSMLLGMYYARTQRKAGNSREGKGRTGQGKG